MGSAKVFLKQGKILPVGYHEVVWNGKNDIGLQMPSGVYMFRIESKNFQQVNKMLLLK